MSTSSQAEKVLAAAVARIEARLRTQLRADGAFVRRLLDHAAAGRGKRLRARLTLLSARLCGAAGARVEQLAAAMELLHQATLVHDDVIDESRQRRHQATLNARFGNQAAVLAGDLIFVKAINLLLGGDFSTAVNRIVARAASDVCVGEIQELQCQQNPALTAAEYLEVVSKKTASLLAAACESGATLAGAAAAVCGRLARYGFEFGIAFQIQDDLLDVIGRSERLGKPVGADMKEGRITLPVIFGLQRCRGRERQVLLAAVRRTHLHSEQVRHLLERSGALAQARDLAREYAQRAQAAVREFPETPARAALLDLAEFAVERNH